MRRKRVPLGCAFWLQWIVASALGAGVAVATTFAVGVAQGIVQVLGQDMPYPDAYILGWATGIAGFTLIPNLVSVAAVGMVQGFVLRALREQISPAAWWFLACAVGSAVGFAVSLNLNFATSFGGGLVGSAFHSTGASLGGATTGLVLAFLLRYGLRPSQGAKNGSNQTDEMHGEPRDVVPTPTTG